MTELAEVFRLHGPAYRTKFAGRIPRPHLRAMTAIESCRTPARGGQVYLCKGCKDYRFSYHSCRNRHCPKCQGDEAARWLERRQDLLLPAPTFLVTFTVPEELRALVRSHARALLGILFRSSSAALRQLARDPRLLGGEIGCLGVLHTWARSLVFHPHVHYVVPGGALAGDTWRTVPRPGFLVPVEALSRIFRAKFRDAVLELDRTNGTDHFSQVPSGTWRRPWVVHCKPVGDGTGALKYLARYVFRVALGQNQIVSLQNGVVTFRYKDSETGRHRTCPLPAEEFIRRFLQHVLPHRFVKVRSYGLFARSHRARLERARVLGARRASRAGLQIGPPPKPQRRPVDVCPRCQTRMDLVGSVQPRGP